MTPDFIISTGAFPGVRLAWLGHWGGIAFATVEDAEAEALRVKPGARIAREHVQVRRSRMFR